MKKPEKQTGIEIRHAEVTVEGQVLDMVALQAIGPADEIDDLFQLLRTTVDNWSGKQSARFSGEEMALLTQPTPSKKVN